MTDPEFPRGAPTPKVGRGQANLLFGEIFPENAMKMKKIGPEARVQNVSM